MKEQLIKYLQSKQAGFTVAEVNEIIGIINQLEEPKAEEPKDDKKK